MTNLDTSRSRNETAPCAIPADLSAWLDRKALASLVLSAVLDVDERSLRPVAGGTSAAFRPRTMLALLTYCYAVELYGSQDIEEWMYRDTIFRSLCDNEVPDWKSLRRFRRHNHDAIHRCLVRTFASASRASFVELCRLKFAGGTDQPSFGTGRFGWLALSQVTDEVDRRIEQAMWMDGMSADD